VAQAEENEDAVRREALVADIGGTNARFALADLATLELSHVGQIRCAAQLSLTSPEELEPNDVLMRGICGPYDVLSQNTEFIAVTPTNFLA
jgi:hypothetical protein